MSDFELEVVDGLKLSAEHRALLLPGEAVADGRGIVHHLPRYFYALPSWSAVAAAVPAADPANAADTAAATGGPVEYVR